MNRGPQIRRAIALLPLAALLIQAGSAARVQSLDPRLAARGSFWSATSAEGAPLTLDQPPDKGLVLTSNARIHFDPAVIGNGRRARLDFTLLRMVDEAHAEVRFCDDGESAYLLKLGPQASFGVSLLLDRSGARPISLARAEGADRIGKARERFAASLTIDGPRITLAIDGDTVLDTTDAALSSGDVALVARTGALRVIDMGCVPGGEAGGPTQREDFRSLAPAVVWPVVARRTLAGVLLLAFLALWLRSLCLIAPAAGRLGVATGLLAAPLAIAAIVAACSSLPLPRLAVPLLLIGALPALLHLRPDRHLGDADPTARTRPWRLVLVIAIALCIVGGASLRMRQGQLRPWLAQLQLARVEPPATPHADAQTSTLRADNALEIPGRFRDCEVRAQVALTPGALLEVRLRAQGPEGVALLLSADDRVASRFVRETRDGFADIGSSSTALTSSLSHELVIVCQGSRFTATWNDELIARANEPLFPAGAIALLAARGTATVGDIRVTPMAAAPAGLPRAVPLLSAVLAPIALLVALAFVIARLLHRPWLPTLAGTALSALPFALGCALIRGGSPLEAWLASHLALAAIAMLIAPALMHLRTTGFLRFQAVAALAISVGTLGFLTLRHTAWPASIAAQNALTCLAWSGERLHGDLLHHEHPLLRRWNGYLVDHRFKRRAVSLSKPPGTIRIISLGSSSTFGFGVDSDYPTLAEQRLNQAGDLPQVEIINAAWNGAVGNRLLQLLRNVLLEFRPDVVTLSLYYNDAVNLTQLDEAAYLERITAPDYRRSLLDDLRERIRITAGAGRFEQLHRAAQAAAMPEPVRWDAPFAAPPERFRDLLREFASLGREHGFQLVLIKEPIAGDRERIWKREFRAAMDQVGAESGLRVVDPTPALLEQGGAALFSDEVHPYADGHRIIAEVLAEVLRDLIRQR